MGGGGNLHYHGDCGIHQRPDLFRTTDDPCVFVAWILAMYACGLDKEQMLYEVLALVVVYVHGQNPSPCLILGGVDRCGGPLEIVL